MVTVLKAQKIRKIYGAKGNVFSALHNISVEICRSEYIGIMGPSGAGKTTLLNVFSSIDQPTSGKIEIGGKNLASMREKELALFRRNKLGFIFQDCNLIETMSVKDNIVLPLTLNKIKITEIEERFEAIAKQFKIFDLKDKFPTQISGGQKQRTAVCRALITKPELVFADEPTGALDSKSATHLLEELEKAKQLYEATICMVTHDAFAASFCERVLFIKDGSIFTEIYRGNTTRKQFFQKILDVLAMLGGEVNDDL